MTRRWIAIGALALTAAGCKGAEVPTGECLSYACDADGAKAMLRETLDATYEPSEAARTAFEEAFGNAVAQMEKQGGFTPESFELARGNFKKFLDEVPETGSDPLAPEAEALKKKSAKQCPLFPFC